MNYRTGHRPLEFSVLDRLAFDRACFQEVQPKPSSFVTNALVQSIHFFQSGIAVDPLDFLVSSQTLNAASSKPRHRLTLLHSKPLTCHKPLLPIQKLKLWPQPSPALPTIKAGLQLQRVQACYTSSA